jgi:hypothetical protein
MTKTRTLIVLVLMFVLMSMCLGRCSSYKKSLSNLRSSANRREKELGNIVSHLYEQRVDIPIGWAMKMAFAKTGVVYGWMEGVYKPTTNIYRETMITIVPSTDIPPGVRIYHDREFTGLFAVLGMGAYAKKDLPFPARTISSISIHDGQVVTIYRNPSFMGDSKTLTHSTGNLGWFDNSIESLEVEEFVCSNQSHKAIAYKQKDFQGKMMLLTIGVNKVDGISASFKVEEGYIATLHTKEEWYVILSSGHHRHIIPWTHDHITITISALSDVILPYASLYEHDAFDGLRADVLETRMSKVPIGISSLSVQSGYAIRLYSEEEFKGRNVLVIGMVKSLTMYTFNDKVRSLEVVTTEYADEQPMLCKESTCYTLPLGKTVSYDEILWNPHNLNVPKGYIVSIERFGYMMQYVNGHDQIEFNWSWLFPIKAYVVTKV